MNQLLGTVCENVDARNENVGARARRCPGARIYRGHLRNCSNDIHSTDDFAEDRVFSVQTGRIVSKVDEKLRP